LATTSNLERTLTENPVGLHFSGHGYVNDKDFYLGEGREFSAHGEKGDILIFENENGGGDAELLYAS
jgi:hypothetical protein